MRRVWRSEVGGKVQEVGERVRGKRKKGKRRSIIRKMVDGVVAMADGVKEKVSGGVASADRALDSMDQALDNMTGEECGTIHS